MNALRWVPALMMGVGIAAACCVVDALRDLDPEVIID